MKHLITSLVLVCVLVQTVFGGLQDSVVICLGGGHDHEVLERTAPPATLCCNGCSHNDQWPAVEDEHAGCGCTDIELALIELLSIPRTIDNDGASATTAPAPLPTASAQGLLTTHPDRGPPPNQLVHAWPSEHTAGALRLAIVRSTRLLL